VDGQQELLRVLVVDDEPNIVDVVSMALRHNGFAVDATDTGADALARARRWRPHVMVLDVMFPDMNGFEVARRLSSEHLGVPILFLSARDATSDKVRGLTTGGTVEAASHPEGGALFTVRLPEASPDAEPEPSGAALEPAPAAVAP
jgi:CheY-like chemotaxis protein